MARPPLNSQPSSVFPFLLVLGLTLGPLSGLAQAQTAEHQATAVAQGLPGGVTETECPAETPQEESFIPQAAASQAEKTCLVGTIYKSLTQGKDRRRVEKLPEAVEICAFFDPPDGFAPTTCEGAPKITTDAQGGYSFTPPEKLSGRGGRVAVLVMLSPKGKYKIIGSAKDDVPAVPADWPRVEKGRAATTIILGQTTTLNLLAKKVCHRGKEAVASPTPSPSPTPDQGPQVTFQITARDLTDGVVTKEASSGEAATVTVAKGGLVSLARLKWQVSGAKPGGVRLSRNGQAYPPSGLASEGILRTDEHTVETAYIIEAEGASGKKTVRTIIVRVR